VGIAESGDPLLLFFAEPELAADQDQLSAIFGSACQARD
jgi:hypothetical protein